MFVVFSFTIIFFPQISFAISQNASELGWPLKGHRDRQQMAHRPNTAAITMGQYSERDGDRDLLENAGNDHSEKGRRSSQTVGGGWTIGQTEQQQHQMLNHPNSFMQQPKPQQTLSRPIRPIGQSLTVGGSARGALFRYDTNLSRFASGPSVANNRIVLPSIFVKNIRNGAYGKAFAEQQPQLKTDNGRQKAAEMPKGTDNDGIERPKTLILTNERIAKLSDIPTETTTTNGTVTELKAVPLDEFRHEDIRPAVDGERLGPQAKYAGQTNEYKEDWGKQFTTTDRRSSGGKAAQYYGPSKNNGEDGPANRMAGMDINPPPKGTRIQMDEETRNEEKVNERQWNGRDGRVNERERQWHERDGRINPYVNAAEEITGSRFRNIDEKLNAMNGGQAITDM